MRVEVPLDTQSHSFLQDGPGPKKPGSSLFRGVPDLSAEKYEGVLLRAR